jgi:putative hemolysin
VDKSDSVSSHRKRYAKDHIAFISLLFSYRLTEHWITPPSGRYVLSIQPCAQPKCAREMYPKEEIMPGGDGSMADLLGIAAILVLVAANGFFVASEFSLVAVRRSRVAQLVAAGRSDAVVLQHAIDSLDANLAATQLGITISSLALGWIGEPALAHLVEPLFGGFVGSVAAASSHAVAIAISFIIITVLHIVLGELAPKSFALQRTERTALAVARPLGLFRFLFWPAITTLNGLGNLVLRLCGLRPGGAEGSLHSPEELRLLVSESAQAGLLQEVQHEVVNRVISIGERPIGDIMTPRPEIDWVDANDSRDEMLRSIRNSPHEQILVCRSAIDNTLGIVLKKDLLDQALDGTPIDPMTSIRQPLVVPERMSIVRVFEQFKRRPTRLALVVDEYGGVEGIVTQTDLLEAVAGDIPESADEELDVVERGDGSLLMNGMMAAYEALDRLGISMMTGHTGFHTLAGFVIHQLGRIPATGDHFIWRGWRFEVVDMDGQRIDKVLVSRAPPDSDNHDQAR